jgi:hypothetical protein
MSATSEDQRPDHPERQRTSRGSNGPDPAVDQLYSRGRLVHMPSLRGRNLVLRQKLLFHIATTSFEPGRTYTEPEVNERLMAVYDDYTALRRYLVEEHFLDRDRAGSQYRLPEGRTLILDGPAPAARPGGR